MLLQSTLLREEADHYALTGPLAAVTIPTTLYDSLMARLDRLPMVREVAQLGAALGREFAYELLHALTTMEEATLQHGLTQLVGAELLYQRGLAAPCPLHLQACAHPGCRLHLAAEKHPTAVSPADCAAPRSPVSRDRRGRAGTLGTPLHRSWVPRAGRGLLAEATGHSSAPPMWRLSPMCNAGSACSPCSQTPRSAPSTSSTY